MTQSTFSRRRVLCLTGLALPGAALSHLAGSRLLADAPWYSELVEKVKARASWVRIAESPAGVRLLCGVRNASLWAGCAGELFGSGSKVLARGNTILGTMGQRQVTITLCPETA